MFIAIRADAAVDIGGGHVMRCLSLADAAAKNGHEVVFLCVKTEGHLGARISELGFNVLWLEQSEAHTKCISAENWHLISPEEDTAQTQELLGSRVPDWLVLDHYGLGGRWVKTMRSHFGSSRVLALDDLDQEPLFADLSLNPTACRHTKIQQPYMAMLRGPSHALLGQEFAKAALSALEHRTRPVEKILILPGMMDAAGLAPAALHALDRFPEFSVDVIMGSKSQTLEQVKEMVDQRPNASLVLDAKDMCRRMLEADLCIGAGGSTAWERCCLALPSVCVAVAANQKPGLALLEEAKAAICLESSALTNHKEISEAVDALLQNYASYSANAFSLCDGQGSQRVVDAMCGSLRSVTKEDANLLFEWRNQPRIRNASLNNQQLVWNDHVAYIDRITSGRSKGIWTVYSEQGKELGHVNAVPSEGKYWRWSFYIGENDAPSGSGRRMLGAFLSDILQRDDIDGICATVLKNNTKSIHLHQSLGFTTHTGTSNDSFEFRLEKIDLRKRLGFGG